MILGKDLEQANRLLLEKQRETAEPKKLSTAHVHPLKKREPVLITCRDCKYLEIYCAEYLDLQFLNCPVGVGQLQIEHFIESTLPTRHRRQFAPGFLRRRFEVEMLTQCEISNRVARTKAIQGLRTDGGKYSELQIQRIACGGIV
jgi:hypothetical protein